MSIRWGFTRRSTSRSLPERNADEPLRGHKHARLTIDNVTGRFAFAGVYTHGPYGVEADAECPVNKFRDTQHRAPSLHCSCGFYAYKDRFDAAIVRELHCNQWPMAAELSVDLSGRVIVHHDGYRAEHQRVMQATVVTLRCTAAARLQREPVLFETTQTYVTTTDGAYGPWGLPLCNRPAVAVRTRNAMRRFVLTTTAHGIGITFCSDHARAHPYRDELEFNILDRLRADLPTEWRTI